MTIYFNESGSTTQGGLAPPTCGSTITYTVANPTVNNNNKLVTASVKFSDVLEPHTQGGSGERCKPLTAIIYNNGQYFGTMSFNDITLVPGHAGANGASVFQGILGIYSLFLVWTFECAPAAAPIIVPPTPTPTPTPAQRVLCNILYGDTFSYFGISHLVSGSSGMLLINPPSRGGVSFDGYLYGSGYWAGRPNTSTQLKRIDGKVNPVVAAPGQWRYVNTFGSMAYAIDANSDLYTWGIDTFGESCLDRKGETIAEPTRVTDEFMPKLTKMSYNQIAPGNGFTAFLTKQGEIYYVGKNSMEAYLGVSLKWTSDTAFERIDNNGVAYLYKPTLIASSPTYKQIYACDSALIIVDVSGGLHVIGENKCGVLGINQKEGYTTNKVIPMLNPIPVQTLGSGAGPGVEGIGLGVGVGFGVRTSRTNAMAITRDGDLLFWGGFVGQSGLPTNIYKPTKLTLPESGVIDYQPNTSGCLVVFKSGNVYAYGYSIIDNNNAPDTFSSDFVQVGFGSINGALVLAHGSPERNGYVLVKDFVKPQLPVGLGLCMTIFDKIANADTITDANGIQFYIGDTIEVKLDVTTNPYNGKYTITNIEKFTVGTKITKQMRLTCLSGNCLAGGFPGVLTVPAVLPDLRSLTSTSGASIIPAPAGTSPVYTITFNPSCGTSPTPTPTTPTPTPATPTPTPATPTPTPATPTPTPTTSKLKVLYTAWK